MQNSILDDITIKIEEYNKPLPNHILIQPIMIHKEKENSRLQKSNLLLNSNKIELIKVNRTQLESEEEEPVTPNSQEPLSTPVTIQEQSTASTVKIIPFNFIDINKAITQEYLSNSDILLAILEVASNRGQYCIAYANTTKLFWELALKHKSLGEIFKHYKAETLRKYWKLIRFASTLKVYHVITSNRELIDSMTHIKLKPLIEAISKYAQSSEPIKDFEAFLNKAKKTKSNGFDNRKVLSQFNEDDRKVIASIEKKDIKVFKCFDRIVADFQKMFVDFDEAFIRNELVNSLMDFEKCFLSLMEKKTKDKE